MFLFLSKLLQRLAGIEAGSAKGFSCSGKLNRAVRENNSLTRSDEPVYVELHGGVSHTNPEIAFCGKSHLLDIFAAEEVSNAKRERASSSGNLPIFSVVSDDCCSLRLILFQDRQ